MKKFIFSFLVLSFVIALSGFITTRKAEAIPPFARKYQTACPTCHVVIPRLNPFGRAFRANGYRIPGGADEVFTKDEPLLLGANPWKKMFPKTIWPSDIPGLPPIGLEVVTGMTVGLNNETTKTEFNGIDEFAMLMGGTMGESFSFFGDVNLYKFDSPKTGWIERMFIQYNPDWFGGKGHINLRVGEFEPRIVGPFSNHRSIQIMSWFMGYLNTTMPVIATNEEGVQIIRDFSGFYPNQKGIEIYGGFDGKNGGGWEYAAGVVNGEASHAQDIQTAATSGTGGSNPSLFVPASGGRFETNDEKDWYVGLHYKFGGMGVLGGGGDGDELAATDNWKDNNGSLPSVKIGGYFYRGSLDRADETVNQGTAEEAETNNDQHYTRAQADIDVFWGNMNLIAGYTVLHNKAGDGDTDSFEVDVVNEFTGPNGNTISIPGKETRQSDVGMDTTVNIFTGEISYVVLPWLIPTWKTEFVQSDFGASFNKNTVTVTALLRANIKFQAGVQWTDNKTNTPGSPRVYQDVVALGLQYDF